MANEARSVGSEYTPEQRAKFRELVIDAMATALNRAQASAEAKAHPGGLSGVLADRGAAVVSMTSATFFGVSRSADAERQTGIRAVGVPSAEYAAECRSCEACPDGICSRHHPDDREAAMRAHPEPAGMTALGAALTRSWAEPEAKQAAGKVEPSPPTSGGPNRHARRAAERGGR